MIGKVLQDRYQIESQLGEGGMGVVYRARDTLLERDVAVKVLAQQGLGTEWQTRMLNEARAAAKLNQANIVTVYDVGEYEEAPFIVMELVQGKALDNEMPSTTDGVIALAQQLCEALEHAHAQGIVHRDIKPANVILTLGGTAKLMDFGIAHSPSSQLTQEGAVLGTINYIAPEQAMGEEVDGRADLYSLGVMLYELVTGRLPFEADNPLAIITQHLHAPVVPPRAKNEAIPRKLDRLIVQLLSKEPADRPASAAEVRKVLAQLSSEATTSTVDLADYKELSMLDRIVRGRMAGRKRELAEARTYWQRAQSGDGQLLLISGEPGIGKTRLVQEIATLVEVSGGLVLKGESFAEGSAPYAPVAQMIRGALSHNFDLALPNLVLADLITIAPDLQARYPDVPPNPPLDPIAEQQRLFESFALFCEALSAHSPLLLFLDDVHWADSGTLYLMRYLARRLQKSPVLLVATYREIELDEAHPFQDVLLDLNRARLANRLKLSRLGREAAKAMLEILFAEDITPDFLDSIYRETEGNPFFLEEVCKALVESGKLYFEDGVWHRPSMEELEIPQSIRAAIQSRVAGLSSGSQKVLQWAAIFGREFDFEPLLEVSQMDEDGLIDALEEAQEMQLIEEVHAKGAERFAFAHALIPTTLRDNLSGLRRGRVHRKVAAVIEKLHLDDYKALAYHYGEAGDETRALSYLTQAAHQARRVYANEDAVRYYSEGLSLIPADHFERFDLLAARAKVLDLLGRREEQLNDLKEMRSLAEQQGNQSRQVEALIALTDYYLAAEAWDVSPHTQGLAEGAVEIARQVADPVQEAHVLRRMGMVARQKSEWQEGHGWLEEAVTLFKDNELPGDAAACLNVLSEILGDTRNYQEAQQVSEEALALSQKAGNRRQEATSLRSLAYAHLYQNKPDQALPLAEAALEINHQMGDLAEETATQQALGLIFFKLEQMEKTLHHLRKANELAELLGFGWIIAQSTGYVLDLDFRVQGNYQSGVDFLDERLAISQSVEEELLNKTLFITFNYHKMEMLEFVGMYREALQVANDLLSVAEEIEFQVPRILSWIHRLQAELGQSEEALYLLEALLELEASNYHVLFNAAYVAWLKGDLEDWPVALEWTKTVINIVQGLGEIYYPHLTFALEMGARLSLSLNESKNALTYMEEVMQLLETAPVVYGHEQLYFTYSRALRATEQTQEADEALQQAYKWVMRIAEQTEDEAMHQSWLENVRYNREIIAEAKERGIAE